MDKSYMLNDYIAEQEKDLVAKESANDNLEQLQFRINGSKTVEEIKKEVSIFLEKNNVPFEVEEGLKKICSEFNENTDVYHASIYLENFMKDYFDSKDKKYQDSSDTVLEIKEDVVESVKKDLDSVGISLTSSTDSLIDNIQSEADVYKIKDNVEKTTEYFEQNKEDLVAENKTILELSPDEIENVLEKPADETLLNDVIEQQEQIVDTGLDPQVDVKEDGSIEVQGDATNDESMNFAALMTIALVVSNNEYGFDKSLDMKFIKDPENINKFRIIYADFPLNKNNLVDPNTANKVNNLVNGYQSHVSYMDLLGMNSPELMTSLTIIQEQVLKEKGAFQLAVKNSGVNREMMFAVDENYANISTAFQESGAMVTHDAMEHSIIRVNDTMPGDQLLILSATLDNLRQKEKEAEQNALVAQNQYQKKLVYPTMNNEAANVGKTFLIVSIVTEILLVLAVCIFFFVN